MVAMSSCARRWMLAYSFCRRLCAPAMSMSGPRRVRSMGVPLKRSAGPKPPEPGRLSGVGLPPAGDAGSAIVAAVGQGCGWDMCAAEGREGEAGDARLLRCGLQQRKPCTVVKGMHGKLMHQWHRVALDYEHCLALQTIRSQDIDAKLRALRPISLARRHVIPVLCTQPGDHRDPARTIGKSQRTASNTLSS